MISGKMVQELTMNTLTGLGINVIDIDLSTTPTVEIAVPLEKADGGIILTASHNPKQWNALKLLNKKGEFLDGAAGAKILEYAEQDNFDFSNDNRFEKWIIRRLTWNIRPKPRQIGFEWQRIAYTTWR